MRTVVRRTDHSIEWKWGWFSVGFDWWKPVVFELTRARALVAVACLVISIWNEDDREPEDVWYSDESEARPAPGPRGPSKVAPKPRPVMGQPPFDPPTVEATPAGLVVHRPRPAAPADVVHGVRLADAPAMTLPETRKPPMWTVTLVESMADDRSVQLTAWGDKPYVDASGTWIVYVDTHGRDRLRTVVDLEEVMIGPQEAVKR